MIVKDLTCASDAAMILADVVVLSVCTDDCMDTEMLTHVNVDARLFVVQLAAYVMWIALPMLSIPVPMPSDMVTKSVWQSVIQTCVVLFLWLIFS